MEVKCPNKSHFHPEESRGDGKSKIGVVFFEKDGIFSGCAVAQQPQMVADSVSGGSPKKSLQWLRT